MQDGINKVADAVAVTLGPRGECACHGGAVPTPVPEQLGRPRCCHSRRRYVLIPPARQQSQHSSGRNACGSRLARMPPPIQLRTRARQQQAAASGSGRSVPCDSILLRAPLARCQAASGQLRATASAWRRGLSSAASHSELGAAATHAAFAGILPPGPQLDLAPGWLHALGLHLCCVSLPSCCAALCCRPQRRAGAVLRRAAGDQ